MEHDRFDDLAKKVFSGSSRRRVVAGALASVVGAGVAAVTGVDAKKGKGKSKKGKAKGEFVCTAANANAGLPFGCEPGSCCASTPAGNGPSCINTGLQANSDFCGAPLGTVGVNPGEGVCRKCPAGTRCSGAPDFICVCDAVTCSDGCCIPAGEIGNDDDICVKNGSGEPVNTDDPFFNGAYVCGTGGSICNVCSVGTLFSGCCTATGACSAGTANAACGSNGKTCDICLNDSSCGIDQACTGGTTTTTTTVSPTTTPAPCPVNKKGKQKTACGSNCCGRKQKCITASDGTQRCKKK